MMQPEPENIFDPAHYERQRLPVLEARTLPPWCYSSEDFCRREIERVFLKTWQFVGRTDEIAEPGAYLCAETAGGPVILLRDEQGAVRAFANSCRHRGARLLKDTGQCERIVCPYHGWTYRLDGALRGATEMDQTVDFDRAEYGLTPVRIATWQGFIWISFDPDVESLESYFGDLFERFASYQFDDMVVTRRSRYELGCNWKLIVDNAHEAYHTGVVHGGSIGAQQADALETRGNWEALFHPLEHSVAVLPGEMTSFEHIDGLEGDLGHGTHFTLLCPNTQFACVQDCMWWMTLIPLGPERCINEIGFCFPRGTVARDDFDEVVEKYYHRWDVSIDEDNDTGELQQHGLSSVLREPGPYSYTEDVVHRFANWILDRVLDPPHSGERAA